MLDRRDGPSERARLPRGTADLQVAAGTLRNGELVLPLGASRTLYRARPPSEFATSDSGDSAPIARIVVEPDAVLRLGPRGWRPWSRWRDRLEAWRQRGLARSRALASPRTEHLFRALVFGARGRDFELDDLFTRTGMRHVLCLSGMHVGLVFLLVVRPLGRGLLRLLAWRARTPLEGSLPSAAWEALAIWAFVPLAGANPPVLRAVWALSLALWAPHVGSRGAEDPRRRRADPLSLWCFALLLECLVRPHAALAVGVQLSYAATLGLIVGYAPLRRTLEHRIPALRHTGRTGRARSPLWRIPVERVRGGLLACASASLVAVLGTLPITWAQFGEWAPWGIAILPFALPLVTVFLVAGWAWAVLPIGVFETWLDVTTTGLLELLTFADALPGTPLQLPPRPLWLLAALALLAMLRITTRFRATAFERRAFALALGATCLPWSRAPMGVQFALADVGHGTALAIRTPAGRAWLFDAGSRDRRSVGRDAIAPILRRWEIDSVSLVVSHSHRDHTSGLDWLIRRWPVRVACGAAAPSIGSGSSCDLDTGRAALPGRDPRVTLHLLRGRNARGNEGSRALEVGFGGSERAVLRRRGHGGSGRPGARWILARALHARAPAASWRPGTGGRRVPARSRAARGLGELCGRAPLRRAARSRGAALARHQPRRRPVPRAPGSPGGNRPLDSA